MRKGFNQPLQKRYRLNNQITAPEVRLLDDAGKQIGLVKISEALTMSQEQGLDLVEIASQAQPPVVKLIDFQKFLYQEKKRKQGEKKNAHVSETKQIRFGPFIGDHDLGIKIERAREFIKEGDKVKFIIRFQGRAITKQDLGRKTLDKVIDKMSDIARVEREIHMEGKQMVVAFTKGARETKKEGEIENEKNEKNKIENQKLSSQAV